MSDTLMNDVFISYSRKDKEFVRRLHAALTAHKRNVWVDWEDIPPTAEWRQEIYAGIEGANAFAFIISPNSLASQVCGEELDHALKNKKSLIPILYQDCGSAQMPAAISSHNWINFRDTDNFDTALNTLLTTLDTDLDHVKMHTRLLVRANEWDSKNRNPSFLLRGTDLQDAERWLAASADKHPGPTAIQTAYIASSRQAAQARQRMLLAAMTVAFLVTGILALLALRYAQIATAERDRANLEARISLVRQLSAQAVTRADSQFDVALLLSLEANAIASTLAPAQQREAVDGLIKTLGENPQLVTILRTQSGYPSSVMFSPDGKFLVTNRTRGLMQIWNVEKAAPLGEPFEGRTAVFSPDGNLLVSGSDAGTLQWMTISDRQNLQSLGEPVRSGSRSVISLAISPDGSLLVSGGSTGQIQFWDTTTRRAIGSPLTGHTGSIRHLLFSPDGQTLISASAADATLIFWNVADRTMINQPLKIYPSSITISPDGKRLAYSDTRGTINFLDMASQQPVGASFDTNTRSGVVGLAYSPDGKTLVTGGIDKLVKFWSPATGDPVGQPLVGHTYSVDDLSFSPDGKLLASASEDGTVRLWGLTTIGQRSRSLVGMEDRVWEMAFSPDLNVLAAGGYKGTIWLWDTATGRQIGEPLVGHTHSIGALAFSPDNKRLASASCMETCAQNEVRLWDVATGKQMLALPGVNKGSVSLAFDPTSSVLGVGGTGGVLLLDAATGKQTGDLIPFAEGYTASIDFSPEGALLAIGGGTTIELWDLAKRQAVGSPLEQGESVFTVAFSPGGNILASGGGDKTGGDKSIRLWDVHTGIAIGIPLIGHHGSIVNLAFSADGKTLVSASADGTVRMWDALTGEPVGQAFDPQANAMDVAALSNDGTTLMAGNDDKSLYFWDITLSTLKDRACHIANRNLTASEWTYYLGTTEPHQTCPQFAVAGRE